MTRFCRCVASNRTKSYGIIVLFPLVQVSNSLIFFCEHIYSISSRELNGYSLLCVLKKCTKIYATLQRKAFWRLALLFCVKSSLHVNFVVIMFLFSNNVRIIFSAKNTMQLFPSHSVL